MAGARARALLQAGVAPEDVTWRVAGDEEPLPLDSLPAKAGSQGNTTRSRP